MSKTPSLSAKELINILTKKGFILKRIHGSHHYFYHPNTGKIAVVPMHKQDLPKGTLHAILKQADIKKEELQ